MTEDPPVDTPTKPKLHGQQDSILAMKESCRSEWFDESWKLLTSVVRSCLTHR